MAALQTTAPMSFIVGLRPELCDVRAQLSRQRILRYRPCFLLSPHNGVRHRCLTPLSMEGVSMPIVRQLLILPLVLFVAASPPAYAQQQHVVAPSELATAVTDHVAKQDADRAAIAEAIARPEVREVAATMGVDMSRVSAATNTLDGSGLERAASAARQVNEQLVGGASNIVISTTMIIVLLIIILIVLIAD